MILTRSTAFFDTLQRELHGVEIVSDVKHGTYRDLNCHDDVLYKWPLLQYYNLYFDIQHNNVPFDIITGIVCPKSGWHDEIGWTYRPVTLQLIMDDVVHASWSIGDKDTDDIVMLKLPCPAAWTIFVQLELNMDIPLRLAGQLLSVAQWAVGIWGSKADTAMLKSVWNSAGNSINNNNYTSSSNSNNNKGNISKTNDTYNNGESTTSINPDHSSDVLDSNIDIHWSDIVDSPLIDDVDDDMFGTVALRIY
jgi:hypothetical protein